MQAPGIQEQVYDVVVDVDDITQVGREGWSLEVSKDKLTQLDNIGVGRQLPAALEKVSDCVLPTSADAVVVAVLGLFDRGKTYLLNKLAGNKAPTEKIHTKGLSMKMTRQGRGFLLLDSAGINSPLKQVELPDGWEEQWEESHPVDEDDFEEVDNRLKLMEADKETEKNRLMEESIVSKKATENFLQDLVFDLADVLIVVVNQITWADQQFIQALSHRLQEHNAAHPNNKRLDRLIVVHNFKDTTSMEQLNDHKKAYCEECFVGKMKKINLMVHNVMTEVEYFENYAGDLTHVFLACESLPGADSPAGDLTNESTLAYLRTLVNGVMIPKRKPVLRRLCQSSHRLLKNFFQNVYDVGLFVVPGSEPQTTALRIIGRGCKQLWDNQISIVEGHILLSRPDEVRVNVDVILFDDFMVVLADVPGIVSKNSPFKGTGSQASCWVDTNTNELVIAGSKSLYYRRYITENGNLRPSPHLSFGYAPSMNNVQRVERRGGDFLRRIPIPNNYEKKIADKLLVGGELQVVIKRMPKIVDDPTEHQL